MRFDPKIRRYRDSHGRVMTAREVRKEVEDYVEEEQTKVEKKAEDVLLGTIGLAAFFTWMDGRIETWHKVTGAIAYGGKAQMNDERWARIEKRIESEKEFLAGFQADTTAETVTAEGLANRAAMYADAAYTTYENNVAAREQDAGVALARRVCEDDDSSCDECPELATEEFMPLDEVTDIGGATCGSRCRCFYEFSLEGVEPIRIDATVNEIFSRSEAVQ
jgi:hypothetical protein